jgi:aspartyl protease
MTRFNPASGLIIVVVEVWGPSGSRLARLALDTGATASVIDAAILVSIGYDPALAASRARMTTGSGVEFVPLLPVDRIKALDQERARFPLICHTLPASAGVDGVLGLDFLRGQCLTIDFRGGQVTLA